MVTGQARVLLVEDDPDVRDSTADLLTTLGFCVVMAAEAREALSILDQDPAIGVLFSDIAMPGGMNGAQLAVEARRIHPDLKVLLASGYPASMLAQKYDLPENIRALQTLHPRRLDEGDSSPERNQLAWMPDGSRRSSWQFGVGLASRRGWVRTDMGGPNARLASRTAPPGSSTRSPAGPESWVCSFWTARPTSLVRLPLPDPRAVECTDRRTLHANSMLLC